VSNFPSHSGSRPRALKLRHGVGRRRMTKRHGNHQRQPLIPVDPGNIPPRPIHPAHPRRNQAGSPGRPRNAATAQGEAFQPHLLRHGSGLRPGYRGGEIPRSEFKDVSGLVWWYLPGVRYARLPVVVRGRADDVCITQSHHRPTLTPRQKGLKAVFDEAIRAVLMPADRSNGGGKKKTKKACVIL